MKWKLFALVALFLMAALVEGYKPGKVEANPAVKAEKEITSADLPNNREGFIEALRPLCRNLQAVWGVPYEVVLAQACMETGYGKFIPGNNILGLGHTVGKRKLVSVKRNGKFIKLYCTTYVFKSINDCLLSYGVLVSTKPIYKKAMACRESNSEFITALSRAGYCRKAPYPRKILWIISNQIRK